MKTATQKDIFKDNRYETSYFEGVDATYLENELKSAVTGEVRFDRGSKALYATDASNYRQVPIGVVLPKNVRDIERTVAICRKYKAPLLSRGGGTSLTGAIVASMSIPWGATKGDKDIGGYHMVWSRDLVETSGGLLAMGTRPDTWRILNCQQWIAFGTDIKLCASLKQKKVFDMPEHPRVRYLENKNPSKCERWAFEQPCESMAKGKKLRIETRAPALIHWSKDDWKTVKDMETTNTGLEINIAPLTWTGTSPAKDSKDSRPVIRPIRMQKTTYGTP